LGKKDRVLDLYRDEYKWSKSKGKKVKAKVSEPKTSKSKKAVSVTGTDSQGRSTNPYGNGCSGVADW
jgi:hypothetical protein